MEQKSKFDKVMGAWDILVIAFGAMIGWGWVINSGDWITTAGFAGSIIAMLIGGVMVFVRAEGSQPDALQWKY